MLLEPQHQAQPPAIDSLVFLRPSHNIYTCLWFMLVQNNRKIPLNSSPRNVAVCSVITTVELYRCDDASATLVVCPEPRNYRRA